MDPFVSTWRAVCAHRLDEQGASCAAFLYRAIAYSLGTASTALSGDHLQRLQTIPAPCPGRARHETEVHRALLPRTGRQGGEARPDRRDRVGLPPSLHQATNARRPSSLDRALQHSTPRRTRRTRTDQPRVPSVGPLQPTMLRASEPQVSARASIRAQAAASFRRKTGLSAGSSAGSHCYQSPRRMR